jgi:hypothetical protein
MICCYDKKEFDKIREIINRIGRDKCIDSTRKRNEILMYLDEYRARKDAHRDGFNSKVYSYIVPVIFGILISLVTELSIYIILLIGLILDNFHKISIDAILKFIDRSSTSVIKISSLIVAMIIVLCICIKIGFPKIKENVELIDKINYIESQIKYLL